MLADPHGLPFAENSLDLIVLPHALEFTDDPHLMLREAYRVDAARRADRDLGLQSVLAVRGASATSAAAQTPPWNGNFIALYRLKDWLALLGFDVVGGRLDCYVPPFAQEKWLRRFGSSRRRAIAGGRSPAASTTCARPRKCSACA